MPFLIRRLAIETHGVDATRYERQLLEADIRGLGPEDTGRRNMMDLAEFIVKVRGSSDDEMKNAWPVLYSGSVNATSAIEMYRRFAAEAIAVCSRYPGVAPLLT